MAEDDRLFGRYLEGERPDDFKTLSGLELEAHYGPDGRAAEAEPGQFPFTRGIHPEMYRSRFWTRRQQSGYGTAEQSNERLHYLLGQGQTGLNINPDAASHLGLDDHELGEGDLGRQGTSLVTLDDMRQLLAGIPIEKVSTTFNFRPPASAVIVAMFLLIARERGVPWSELRGTCTNCALSQVVGPTMQSNTHFFPVDFALRVGTDVMEFCAREMPRWNLLNINAYNIRETGVNAIQEAGFAISLAIDYLERLLARGVAIDDFAPRVGFFCAVHIDFFEEIAKLRAMRRIWARLMRERFGANQDRSCWFRTAVQTSALPLTAQQPHNNIVRAALQTLAGVLGGCQSMHTTGWDEAYALPSEESHKLSLRTQQIIAFETNVVKTADPLGGSHFVEQLTDRLEQEILALVADIDGRGGFVEVFKSGWIEDEINRARLDYWEKIENGERPLVGVNIFEDQSEPPEAEFFELERATIDARIAAIRALRKAERPGLETALEALGAIAAGSQNVMPAMMEAVAAGATIGEIFAAMRSGIGFEIAE
ncbi:MAG TPA: methylmalonyl-CoA mutase family protein [Alphaproteobacteria bacterium]|jgi:methylmalonyl-CoA mutase N-terminal domain/subunit|nr:methylmalonyl-CoA mutase family protein [Alphaproteobacteria bacterium]MDP6269996.1 methylmalonyl-CoA mutase family protein [Alphaproteobacteria bacterium]MDP7428579.1 methylmalonyl-CoA mutase family protein [Alphaproteobacteria bacterium]HJM48837.1 methylmalonyl-CoA mutase family protein [Alphaproteobacteria bacterium]